MEAYAAAKARLFERPELSACVINIDDPWGLALARRLVVEGRAVIACTLYAANADAVPGARVLRADRLQAAPAGLRFTLVWEGGRPIGVRMVALLQRLQPDRGCRCAAGARSRPASTSCRRCSVGWRRRRAHAARRRVCEPLGDRLRASPMPWPRCSKPARHGA